MAYWGSTVLRIKIDLKACIWLTDSYYWEKAWISLTCNWTILNYMLRRWQKYKVTCDRPPLFRLMGARGSHNKTRVYFHNNERVEMFPEAESFFLIKAPVQISRKK